MNIQKAEATNPLKPFPIKVNQGWNQIGNPFRFSRFWNAESIKFSTNENVSDAVDILTAANEGKLIPTLYWRQGKEYTKISADPKVTGSDFASYPGKFEAWTGYMIYMDVGGYLWIDPTTPGPATPLKPSPAAPLYADGAKGWMLELEATLEQTIKTITVGMWEEAKEGEDNFDSPAAPFIASAFDDSNGLEFSIPHPERNNPWAKNYQQDIRAYDGKNSAYWEAYGAYCNTPLPTRFRWAFMP